jgi:hypothetical protein
VQETVARARFPFQNRKKLGCWEHFWKMRSGKVRETAAIDRSRKKHVKT